MLRAPRSESSLDRLGRSRHGRVGHPHRVETDRDSNNVRTAERPCVDRAPAGESMKPEVVVITGASAGVGRATACAFARRGARIGLIARGADGLEGARNDVEALGGTALVLPVDV